MSLTINLPAEMERRLRDRADSEGLPAEAYVLRMIEREVKPPTSAGRPLHELIADVVGEVPEEELLKLPADGASEIDHYVYGHPKRNQ